MFVYGFYIKATDVCIYIGSTNNWKIRVYHHKHNSKIMLTPLYNAIREIGWEAIQIKQIHSNLEWTDVEMKEEEKKLIISLRPIYNTVHNPDRDIRTPEEIAEYHKQYRETHTEEISESKKKCYEAKKDEYLAKAKIYRDSHLEEQAERGKAWREANREENLAKKKAYREANKDAINAKAKAVRDANPEAYKAKQDARNAKVKEALIASRLNM